MCEVFDRSFISNDLTDDGSKTFGFNCLITKIFSEYRTTVKDMSRKLAVVGKKKAARIRIKTACTTRYQSHRAAQESTQRIAAAPG